MRADHGGRGGRWSLRAARERPPSRRRRAARTDRAGASASRMSVGAR